MLEVADLRTQFATPAGALTAGDAESLLGAVADMAERAADYAQALDELEGRRAPRQAQGLVETAPVDELLLLRDRREREVGELDGVASVAADQGSRNVKISWDPDATDWGVIEDLMKGINYPPGG